MTRSRVCWQEFLSAKHADLLKEEDAELVQNKSPKVDAKTLAPASFPSDPDLEWCGAHAQSGQYYSLGPCLLLFLILKRSPVFRNYGDAFNLNTRI